MTAIFRLYIIVLILSEHPVIDHSVHHLFVEMFCHYTIPKIEWDKKKGEKREKWDIYHRSEICSDGFEENRMKRIDVPS